MKFSSSRSIRTMLRIASWTSIRDGALDHDASCLVQAKRMNVIDSKMLSIMLSG